MAEYKIIWAHRISELEDKVNNHLKNGWIPAGGMAIKKNVYTDDAYYQAMFKPKVANAD